MFNEEYYKIGKGLCFSLTFFIQILTKRLKHTLDKYKDLQVDYDEIKMMSEKVKISWWYL